MTERIRVALVGALIAIAVGAPAQSPNDPAPSGPAALDPATRIAPDALVYTEVRDVAALAAAWRTTPWGRLAADPEGRACVATMLDTIEWVRSAASDAIDRANGSPGLLTGRVAFVVHAPPGDRPAPLPPLTLALCGPADAEAAQRTVRVLFGALAVWFDATVEMRTIGGREGLSLCWGDRFAVHAVAGDGEVWIGTDADVLAGCLVPRDRSLRDRPDFQRAVIHVEADRAHHFAWVDLPRVLAQIDGSIGATNPEIGYLVRTLDLARIHTLAFSCSAVEGGFRDRAYIGGKGPAADAVVAKAGITSADAIGDDVVAWFGQRVDVPVWLAWCESVVGRLGEELGVVPAAGWADVVSGWLRSDSAAWLRTLGGEVGLGVALPSAGFVPRIVALASSPDAAASDRALGLLAAIDPWRRLRDRTRTIVWRRGLGALDWIQPTLAVARDWLVAASSPSVARRWIRQRSAALSTRDAYRDAFARLGDGDLGTARAAAWVDVPRLFAFAMNNVAPLVEGREPLAFVWFDRIVRIDWGRLPPTDLVVGAFVPAAATIRRLDDGFRVDAFAPVPYGGVAWALAQGGLVTGLSGTTDVPLVDATDIPGALGASVDGLLGFCRIVGVDEGGAADRAGLAPRDRILAIGDNEVDTPDAAIAALDGRRAGEVVRMRIDRAGRVRSVEVTLQPRR